ncbi:MAG: TrbL/VirB6 family protein [Acidimicrobiales bacterium]
MVRRLARLVAGLFVVCIAIGLPATVASASTAPAQLASPAVAQTAQASQAGSFICSSNSNSSTSAEDYLPINRWAGATSEQHTRLSLNIFNIGNLPDVVQKDFIVAGAQSLGNTFWKAGVGLTEAATRFCFANSVAAKSDGITAALSNALSTSGIIALLLSAAIILVVVRLRRGDGTARQQFVKVLVVLVVFAVMMTGAENTTTGANGEVNFGFGSPGWLLTHTYNAVSAIASAPAAAVAGVADQVNFGGATEQKIDAEDPLSCGNYTNNLRRDYANSYGTGATSNIDATVPLALDSMWEQSGLTTYAYSQFGANNDYAPLVYCRLLEANDNVSPHEQVAITDQTPGASAILAGTADSGGPTTALAWASDQNLGASPNDTVDESLVGWAACETNSPSSTPMEWSSATGAPVASEWASVVNPNASGSTYGATGTVTPQLCKAFFDTGWNKLIPQGTAFEWADNPGAISTAATGPGGPFNGFADYVNTFHGTSNGSAEMLSIMFLISSTVDLLVFGLMAGAVLVAKFSLLFLMAFAGLFLAISLWPGAASSSRLAGLAKHALSMMLFATGAQLILSIVAITTSIIMDTGSAVAGQGSFLALLWMGIAPIAAIFIVHHLFKQVLKAPSPFKLSSALAWGATAGGVGAGAAIGLDRAVERHRSRAWGIAKRGAASLGSPAKTKSLGGGSQRSTRHGMNPASAGAVGAATQAGLGGPATAGAPGARSAPAQVPVANKTTGAPGARSAAGAAADVPAGNKTGGPPVALGSGDPQPVADPVVAAAAVGAAALSLQAVAMRQGHKEREKASVDGSPRPRRWVRPSGERMRAASAGGGAPTERVDAAPAEVAACDAPDAGIGAKKLLAAPDGRVIGAPIPDENGKVAPDTRTAAERAYDDRILRRNEIKAGRQITRSALAARASATKLGKLTSGNPLSNRLVGPESAGGRLLQRTNERTRRAAQEFRAKPIQRQLRSVAKAGVAGVAVMGLAASGPALAIAAGAYAIHRARAHRFGAGALEAAQQSDIETYRASVGREQAARIREARDRHDPQSQGGGGRGSGGGNAASATASTGQPGATGSDEPPVVEPPSDYDDPSDRDLHDWDPEPPTTQPATTQTAGTTQAVQAAPPQASQAPQQASPRRPRPAGRPAAAHQAPTSDAEVLRQGREPAGRTSAERRNEAQTPSHLVGNRRANRPVEDEVPPEVRERFDARDEPEPEPDWP